MGDVLSSGKRKIRKKQQCFGCGRVFEPKTEMNFCNYADNGTVNTTYLCMVCQTVLDDDKDCFFKDNGEIYFEDIKNIDPECWEEVRYSLEEKNK